MRKFTLDPRLTLPKMIYGEADKPFVYRTLLPSIVRLINSIIPDSLSNSFEKFVIQNFPPAQELLNSFKLNQDFLLEFLISLLLMYLCLVGFMVVLRQFFNELYFAQDIITHLVPIIGVLILPIFVNREWIAYIYDWSTLLIFTSLLLLLVRRQWLYFYIIFFLGCINKETTILISLVFAFYYINKISRNIFFKHLFMQIIIFVIVKLSLSLIFASNPGGLFEFHLLKNISLSTFWGYDYSFVTFACFFLLLMLRKFSEKHLFLRKSSLIVLPLFALYLTMGLWGEVRVFYEVFPIFFLLAFHTIAEILDWKIKVIKPQFRHSNPLTI